MKSNSGFSSIRITKHIVKCPGKSLPKQNVIEATKHLLHLYGRSLSTQITRSIKKVLHVCPEGGSGTFSDVELVELTDGEEYIIESLNKSYEESIVNLVSQSDGVLAVDIASDKGGVKFLSINTGSKLIEVYNAKREAVPQLSKPYTGDISFMKAIIKVITARFCISRSSTGCESVIWKKNSNCESVCVPCQNTKRKDQYLKRQKAKKSALQAIEDNLEAVNPHFKDHVVNQMGMANSKKGKYTSRCV